MRKSGKTACDSSRMAGDYSRNAALVRPAEVMVKIGVNTVDLLIRELDLETHFSFKLGQKFAY